MSGCVDCGGRKCNKATRCKPCSVAFRRSQIPGCPDCGGRKVNYRAARCRPCMLAFRRENSTRLTCPDCTGPKSSGAIRCWDCALIHRPDTAHWTRERCLEALHAWIEEHGRVPTSTHWKRATPQHPDSSRIYHIFDGWSGFLKLGGYRPNRPGIVRYWTRDRIAEAMLDFVAREGRWPTTDDWKASDPRGRWPTNMWVRCVFGTWRAAQIYAGRNSLRAVTA